MIRLMVPDEHRQSRTLSAGSISEGARGSAGASRKQRLRGDAENPGCSEPSGRWVSRFEQTDRARGSLPAPNYWLRSQEMIGKCQRFLPLALLAPREPCHAPENPPAAARHAAGGFSGAATAQQATQAGACFVILDEEQAEFAGARWAA